VDVPLLAYYGTQRLWKQIKDTEAKREVGSRFDGHIDCLDPASNHRQLLKWMHRQALATAQSGKPIPHISAIEAAVCQCVEHSTRFYLERCRRKHA
jgi:predicted ATP-binding protein involved in virulence